MVLKIMAGVGRTVRRHLEDIALIAEPTAFLAVRIKLAGVILEAEGMKEFLVFDRQPVIDALQTILAS
jgi:hypothetical protein